MMPKRTVPRDVERLIRPKDPTLLWRGIVGVLVVVAAISILGNVLLGVLFVDYSRNRAARNEAVAEAASAIKAKKVAEDSVAAKDARINELASKVREAEGAIDRCRSDKEIAERELASAKADAGGLPAMRVDRVLQRVGSVRFQSVISTTAVQAGVREGAVAFQAQSVAQNVGFAVDAASQVIVVLRVSGIDQGERGSFWVVEATLTEPWRVPSTDAAFRVIIDSEGKMLSTGKTEGIEADVLAAIDDVTRGLLERIKKAKSQK
jgi:hypothetical protein